jgi:hypothetical protein
MNIGISYDLNATSTSGTISIINKDVSPNIIIAKILSKDREKFGKLKFTIFSDNHLEITNESDEKIFDSSLPLTNAAQQYYMEATQVLTPPPCYKIKFDLNGATGENFDMKIFAPDNDLSPRVIPTPARTGYTFAGWSWRQDYVDSITGRYIENANKFFTADISRTTLTFADSSQDPNSPDADSDYVITMYAQWVKDYTVKFVDVISSVENEVLVKTYHWEQGDTFTTGATHIHFDGVYPENRVYNNTGVNAQGFVGWGYGIGSGVNRGPNGSLTFTPEFNPGQDIYEAYHEINPTGTGTELKVYAKKLDLVSSGAGKNCIVLFHLQDGANSLITKEFLNTDGTTDFNLKSPNENSARAAVSEEFKNNHRFLGWSKLAVDDVIDENSATASIRVDAPTFQNSDIYANEVIDIYAIWQNKYTITFNLNGADSGDTPVSLTKYSKYLLNGNNSILTSLFGIPARIALNAAKTGSNIYGTIGGGTPIAFEPWSTVAEDVRFSGDPIKYPISANINKGLTVYLQWEPNYWLVTLDISHAPVLGTGILYDDNLSRRQFQVPQNVAQQTTQVSWKFNGEDHFGWSVDDYHSTVTGWSDDHIISFWLTNLESDNPIGTNGNPDPTQAYGNYDKYEALYKAWEDSVSETAPNGDSIARTNFENFINSVSKVYVHNTIVQYANRQYCNNELVLREKSAGKYGIYRANVSGKTKDTWVPAEWIEYVPDDIPVYEPGSEYSAGTVILFDEGDNNSHNYIVYKISGTDITTEDTTLVGKANPVSIVPGGTGVGITSGMVLYAVWKYRYEIRFHENKGAPETSDILYTMIIEEDPSGSKTSLDKYPEFKTKFENELSNLVWDSEHEFLGWSTVREDISNTFGLVGKTDRVGMIKNISNNKITLSETASLSEGTLFVIADPNGNIKGKSQNIVISVDGKEVIFQGTKQEAYVSGQWAVIVSSVGKIGKLTHGGATTVGSGNIIQVTSIAGLKNGDTFQIESFETNGQGQEIRSLVNRHVNTVISVNAVERTAVFTAEAAEVYNKGAYIILCGASIKIETATDDVLDHEFKVDTPISRYEVNGINHSQDVWAQWEVKRFITTPIEIPESKTLGQPQIIRGTGKSTDPDYLKDDRLYIPYQNYLIEYDLGTNSYIAHNVNYLESATKTLKHVVDVYDPSKSEQIDLRKLYVKASDQNTFIFNLNAGIRKENGIAESPDSVDSPWNPTSRSTRLDGKSYEYGGPNNRYAYTMRNDGTYKIDLESLANNMNVFTVGTAGNWSHVYTPYASVKYKGDMYYLTVSNSTGPHIRKFTPNETLIAPGNGGTHLDYEEDNIRIYRDVPITSNISEETAPYDMSQMNDLSSVKEVKTAAFDYDSGKWYIFGTNVSGDNEMAIYNLDTNNVTHHNIPQGEFTAAEIVVGNEIRSGGILQGYEKKLFAVCENIRGLLCADVTQYIHHPNYNLTTNDTFTYDIADYPFLNTSYSIVNKDDSRDKDDVFFVAKNILVRCNTDYIQKDYKVLPYSTGAFTESLVIAQDYLEYDEENPDIDGHIYRKKLYTPSSGPTSQDMGKMAIFWIDEIKEAKANLTNLKIYLPGATNYKLGQALVQNDFTALSLPGGIDGNIITLPKNTYAEAALPANYTYSAMESDAPGNTKIAGQMVINREGHYHKGASRIFLPTGGQLVTFDLTSNVYSDANVTLGGSWSSCVVSGPAGARYLYSFPNEVTVHVGRYSIDGGQYLTAGQRTQFEIENGLPPAFKDLTSREYRLAYAMYKPILTPQNEVQFDNNGNVVENTDIERIYLPVSGKMYIYTAGTVPIVAREGDQGYIEGETTYVNATDPAHPEISPNPDYGLISEISIPATNQGSNYYNIAMVQKLNGHKILVFAASHNIVAFDTVTNSYVVCTPPNSLTQSSFNQSSTSPLGRHVFFPDNYGNVVTYDVETNTCSAELFPRQGIPMEGTAVTQDDNIYFVVNGNIIKYNPSGA